ncbi:MAG TPA: chloride channel protein [Candidatus Angelobacter sp.]|nr:chloride channel protein [Candidatus Angelobacter sp.]
MSVVAAENLPNNAVQRFIARWISPQSEKREEQIFLILTLLIGALVGLAVVAFIVLTEHIGMRLYPPGSNAWRRVLIPIAGSLAMGYLLFRYFPNARGSGVPQTKAALFARDGFISLRTVLGKFGCTATTLASGIPLGREGPSVQVGAGIASVLGRAVGLRQEKVKALLPVGASAAIAAAFNTPMAAVLFSLEEVMGDLHAPVLGSVVLASATSWVVLRLMLGNHPLFYVPQYELVHPLEFGVYAVLGVAGGFLSVAFTKLLLAMRRRFLLMPKKSFWWHPVTGGVLVGLMGLFVPQVLGVGYSFVGQALNGTMALKLMALLVVLKLFAITTCYASGNAGGIFGPSLFLGAMLGGAIGSVAHHFLPGYTATPGAYALVGMGALFAGIVRAPMTSVLMIFEMTRDYSVIVPLMIANLASLFISSRFQKQPIYEALAHQDGIHLPNPKAHRELEQRRVSRIMRAPEETLLAQMSVRDAAEQIRVSQFGAWPLMDEGSIVGLVSRVELEKAVADGRSEQNVMKLLDSLDFPHVHADHALHLALERMSSAHLDILPVVNRADVHKLEGVVTLKDVLDSYGVAPKGQG